MSRTGKIFVFAAAAVVVAIVGYRIYLACLSDETRIRRMVTTIEKAYNEGSGQAIRDQLAPHFSEKGTGLTRDELFYFILAFFRQSRAGDEIRRVQVDPGEVKISFGEDPPHSAELIVTARFETLSRDSEKLLRSGAAQFSGQLEKIEDRWLIVSASYRLVEGRWP